MHRAGLIKKTKSVRGKHGNVQRSYWVRATDATKSIVQKHGHKIAAAAAVTATVAGLAYGHRHSISGAYHGAKLAHTNELTKAAGARAGWDAATKKHGSLSATAGKFVHTHLGTDQGRKRTKNTLKKLGHAALSSEMGGELAGHLGTALGGMAGAKLSSRRHTLGGAAVGAIIGKHLGEAAASRGAARLKTRSR